MLTQLPGYDFTNVQFELEIIHNNFAYSFNISMKWRHPQSKSKISVINVIKALLQMRQLK